MYRKVSEVVKVLSDRGFSAPHVTKVNKGSDEKPRWFDAIEWHEVVRMLDEAFGPFGYDIRIVGSYGDSVRGIYTRDVEITGRAEDDETGQVVTLTRAGTGVGIVRGSPDRADGHDMAAHGAKSDGITNASKGLGDGFGLYLYQKGNTNNQTAPARTVAPAANKDDLGFRPSEAQMKFGRSLGWTDEDFAAMPFKEWKAILDEKKRKPAANKVAPVKSQDALVEELFG